MTIEIRFPKKTGALLLVAGLLVFLLYLIFFVPFKDFSTAIQQANLFYYSLAFFALFLAVAFYSLTWHNLLKLLSVKISFMKAFQFTLIGNFVDLLVPAESVSGDASRIYLMSKESGENPGKVVASVIGHRIISGVVTVGGLVISSVYYVLKYQPSLLYIEFIAILNIVSIVSLSLLFYLSTHHQTTERVVNWLVKLLSRLSRGHWRLDHLKSSAEKMLTAFHVGIVTLGEQPKGLVMPFFLAIVAWFFDVFISVLTFYSLGSLNVKISLSSIVIVYSIMIGIQTIPIGIPEGMGLPEISMTALYTWFGVPIAMSAVATILIRVLTLGVKLLIGFIAVQWLGIKGLSSVKSN